VPWPSLLFGAPPCSRLSTAALWSAAPAPAWPAAQAAAAQACACARGRLAAWHQLRGEQLRSWLRHVEQVEQRLVAVAGSLSVLPAGQVRAPCWRTVVDAACSVFAHPLARSLAAPPGQQRAAPQALLTQRSCSPLRPPAASAICLPALQRAVTVGVPLAAAALYGRRAPAHCLAAESSGRLPPADVRLHAHQALFGRFFRAAAEEVRLRGCCTVEGSLQIQCTVCSSLCLLAPPACSTQS